MSQYWLQSQPLILLPRHPSPLPSLVAQLLAIRQVVDRQVVAQQVAALNLGFHSHAPNHHRYLWWRLVLVLSLIPLVALLLD